MRLKHTERYDTIDDRQPGWARNGKLPVAHRRASLRLELTKRGILDYKSPEVVSKLGSSSLAELRRIHTYAAGGVQGSVNVRKEKAEGRGTLVDAQNPSHTVTIAKGESYLSFDFRPYNVHHKNERGLEATYFLFQDLGLTIDALAAKREELPEFTVSATNRVMARLAVRKAGFALCGARVECGGRLFEFAEQTAASIMAGEQDEVLQAADADVELNAFMTTSNFISEANRTDYAHKAELLRKRLAHPGEQAEQTEARLRTEAIQMCLTEMRISDPLKLDRYTYRRDLIEVSDNTSLNPAQEQIASWQPQIGPDGFVLPHYYAK